MIERDENRSHAVAALSRAIGMMGSQVATAKLLGVTQGAVSKWLINRKPVPADHVLRLEDATGVPRHELRPDIYPPSEVPAERTVGAGAPIVPCDRSAQMQRGGRA